LGHGIGTRGGMKVEFREVVVVGGGPAGAATAGLLAQAGHDVLLLDRAAFPRPKACAEYASPETERVLARMGALSAVEDAGLRRLRGISVFGRGGATWQLEHRDGSGARPSFALPRTQVDAALLNWARARGVEVRERQVARRILVNDRQGHVVDAVEAGRERAVRATLLIGADGVRSVVARDLGVSRPLSWPRRLGVVAHYQGLNGSLDRAELHLEHDAYCGVTPYSDDCATVSLVQPLGARPTRAGGLESLFDGLLLRFPSVASRLQTARRVDRPRGVGPLGQRVTAPFAAGALLVGDAAGFFDPLTGEGIFRALRGAELAAEHAHEALRRQDLSDRALAGYARRRRDVFAAKARLAWLMQAFARWPRLADYALRRLQARERVSEQLGGALGDFGSATRVLTPAYLAVLLRP
jgi:menaquinone-9 beta-reductase